MKICLKILLLIAAIAATPMAAAAAPEWESADSVEVTADADSEGVAVEVRDGTIYVRTSKPVTVKVMSILGQKVSEERLPAGTSKFRVDVRGIYILKIGATTKRITI